MRWRSAGVAGGGAARLWAVGNWWLTVQVGRRGDGEVL